mmetsp:Transcript_18750/g.40329  ORF Transcript_18750/g.40329 Transcript_18750/m.40329 type:complete len:211 (+) Transcript_18750:447-1079(+)|eukprot:CAMPEP_0202889962 /NCGR_PEP_ID=MMETSP1392-20130828/490_1 /ASSEMBLY_ACC=CAM_ASM_000868 /TAXON_ID=225041 /ORGANISM="Chlamydomonas chlamydogama, Strain SAG 11-48b" /LENGTH=210 /DNA_ID=CAMNT_0049573417 /DNA_START=434 /DNA_END=1066 /DNA_ORIENTATION=-
MAALRSKSCPPVRTSVGTTPTPLRYVITHVAQPQHAQSLRPVAVMADAGGNGNGGRGQVPPIAPNGGDSGWPSALLRWQPTIMLVIGVVAFWEIIHSKAVQDLTSGMHAVGSAALNAVDKHGKDVGSAAKDVGSAAKDVGSAAKDVGSAAKDVGIGVKDMGVGVKDVGAAAKSLASSKVPPHIAHMLGLGMVGVGLCGIGVGMYLTVNKR